MGEKSLAQYEELPDDPYGVFSGRAHLYAGQGIMELWRMLGVEEELVPGAASVTLVLFSVLATGFGVYDKLAKHAGAGTLVPITGFANAVASPALEFKSEGLILGLGAKLFSIAGPVIVYGAAASFVYGILYFLLKK